LVPGGIDCNGIYFGTVLQGIRLKKYITLEILSDFVSYSTSTISRWETNTAIPPHSEIVQSLSSALRCSRKERLKLEEAYYCSVLRQRGLCK